MDNSASSSFERRVLLACVISVLLFAIISLAVQIADFVGGGVAGWGIVGGLVRSLLLIALAAISLPLIRNFWAAPRTTGGD